MDKKQYREILFFCGSETDLGNEKFLIGVYCFYEIICCIIKKRF